MEKILQRVKRAERSVGKRAAREKKMEKGGEAWERNQQRLMQIRVNSKQHREARHNWKTNWETGSLAPRLDVGEFVESYGTATVYNIQLPERQLGGRKWMPIAKGDRVVATFGPDRGKIGYVSEANEERQSVTVQGVNQEEILVPEWVRRQDAPENPNEPAIQTVSQALPIEHVKLVYPLPNPKTGIPQDVIIDRLEKVSLQEPQGGRENTDQRTEYRAIAGSDVVIPWPELPSVKEDEVHEVDTPRIIVDEITFRPYLMRPPMPTSVIDELRNKYSRFRTRHTPEFEQTLEARTAREEKRKGLGKTMRTPLQELAELRARQKAAEEKVLTDEQLAKIGAVMAQGKQSFVQRTTAP